MSIEQIQRFIQRFEVMFNRHKLVLADEIFAPDFVAHFPIAPALNITTYKEFLQSFYVSFPDLSVKVNDIIASDDKFVLRVTYYGTHLGEFIGVQATGGHISMPGTCIFHMRDNQVVENWTEIDILGVLWQIRSVPPLGGLAAKVYVN